MKTMFLPFALFILLLSACYKDGDGLLLFSLLLPQGSSTSCDSKATPYIGRLATEGHLPSVPLTDGSRVLFTLQNALYWHDLSKGQLLRKIESPLAAKAFSYPDAIYRHGDLAVAASTSGLAVFNIKTGELAWERFLGDCAINQGVFGVGNQYFVTRKITERDGISAHAVFVGDLRDRERLDLLFTPSYSRSAHNWAGYGWITALAPFTGADGHAYLLTAFFEPTPDSYALHNFLGLYDVTTRTWVYERRPIFGHSADTQTGIQHLVISGTTAQISVEDKVINWDLAKGTVRDSMVLSITAGYGPGYVTAHQLWANEQYIIVLTNNGDVRVFDKTSRAVLYRIDQGSTTVRVAFDLNRLFVPTGGSVSVYEISTGKKLETIRAPCEQFTENLSACKDEQGALQLAMEGGAGNIYRYMLQP